MPRGELQPLVRIELNLPHGERRYGRGDLAQDPLYPQTGVAARLCDQDDLRGLTLLLAQRRLDGLEDLRVGHRHVRRTVIRSPEDDSL